AHRRLRDADGRLRLGTHGTLQRRVLESRGRARPARRRRYGERRARLAVPARRRLRRAAEERSRRYQAMQRGQPGRPYSRRALLEALRSGRHPVGTRRLERGAAQGRACARADGNHGLRRAAHARALERAWRAGGARREARVMSTEHDAANAERAHGPASDEPERAADDDVAGNAGSAGSLDDNVDESSNENADETP